MTSESGERGARNNPRRAILHGHLLFEKLRMTLFQLIGKPVPQKGDRLSFSPDQAFRIRHRSPSKAKPYFRICSSGIPL